VVNFLGVYHYNEHSATTECTQFGYRLSLRQAAGVRSDFIMDGWALTWPLCLIGRCCRDLIVAAVPGAALLPLPGEFDALTRGEAADTECAPI
jgi:hypothetical protein